MSRIHRRDPAVPTVTFDNYVFPETVRKYPAPNVVQVDNRFLLIGAAVVLTVLVGVLATFQFAGRGPSQTASNASGDAPVILSTAEQEEGLIDSDGANAVSASHALNQAVTRSLSVSLIGEIDGAQQDPSDTLNMGEILQGLLSANGQDRAGDFSQEVISRGQLERLREAVLAGSYSVEATGRNGQERLILRIPDGDLAQDEAVTLLRQAAITEAIKLPDSLGTPDGDFDADTLIFNLVQTSLADDGTEEGAEAAREMARRAFVASKARTNRVNGERIYTVKQGDSLAYLSLQFYGRPSEYERIFEANRSILTSPNELQIGQHLKIPG